MEACPVCGKPNKRWHVFTNHLPVVACGFRLNKKQCWCGCCLDALDWEDHVAEVGGVTVHYLACALGLNNPGVPFGTPETSKHG